MPGLQITRANIQRPPSPTHAWTLCAGDVVHLGAGGKAAAWRRIKMHGLRVLPGSTRSTKRKPNSIDEKATPTQRALRACYFPFQREREAAARSGWVRGEVGRVKCRNTLCFGTKSGRRFVISKGIRGAMKTRLLDFPAECATVHHFVVHAPPHFASQSQFL